MPAIAVTPMATATAAAAAIRSRNFVWTLRSASQRTRTFPVPLDGSGVWDAWGRTADMTRTHLRRGPAGCPGPTRTLVTATCRVPGKHPNAPAGGVRVQSYSPYPGHAPGAGRTG